VKPTLLLLVFVAGVSARPQEPVGGRGRAALETAVIRGRVMAAGPDSGMRKARVTLTPETGAPHDPIYTDSEGRFEFSGVAPGRYLVAAWKSGWVETKFGARSFWDRHVSIVAAAGAVVDDVQLTLEKGAAISGRVLDEQGAPLSGRAVSIGRAVVQDGRLSFVSVGETDTDDLGEYRVGGLPAGVFVVGVFGFPPPPDPATRRAVSGPLLFDPLQRPHAAYYPQSLSLTQATPISLRAGDDVGAMDVIFTSTGSSARVTGRVVDPQARSTSFSISVLSDGNGMPAARMGLSMTLPQSGEFSVPVGPGEYTLVGQSDNGAATQRLNVGEEDIGGIQLVIANHSRVSGRVVFEGTTPRPVGRLMVEAWSADPLGMAAIRAGAEQDGRPAPVGANDRFTLTGVFGRRELRVNQLPPAWIVKSITTGGRDVLDVPIDFKGGEDLRDVVITVTDRTAALNGAVLDTRGGPASGMSVLLFAEDPRQLPRRAHWEKPDQLGRFVMSGLPAGSYLIALVADVDDSRWSTAEYLDLFRAQAIRLTLEDGEKKAITLRWSDPR
jgi:protocatechuate 3,4-dioxygenase beta subunit